MRAITFGHSARVLAPAKPVSLLFVDREFNRAEARAAMRAVAKRLLAGTSALTPPIATRFQLNLVRPPLRHFGFAHDCTPCVILPHA